MRSKFKAKVVHNDPMTNPADGWVTGFYYEDLCLDEDHNPVMKSFIRSGEMIWEVIPESVSNGTSLLIPDVNGKNIQIFEGDIIAIYEEGKYCGWSEYVIGWDNKGFQLGICPVLYYFCDRPGAKDGFVGRELRSALCRWYVCRLPLHAYDLTQRFKISDTYENDPFNIAHETSKKIIIPEKWEPVIIMD